MQGLWETIGQQPVKGQQKGSGDQWLENLSRGKRTADKLGAVHPPGNGVAQLLACDIARPADASGNAAAPGSSSQPDASGKKMVRNGV